jgi:hypothetical protein
LQWRRRGCSAAAPSFIRLAFLFNFFFFKLSLSQSKAAAAKRAAQEKESKKDKKDDKAIKAIMDRMQAVYERRDKAQAAAPSELSLTELKEDMGALAGPIADLVKVCFAVFLLLKSHFCCSSASCNTLRTST